MSSSPKCAALVTSGSSTVGGIHADWLYDERVDPHPHPATVRDATIRLMTVEKYWIPA